jgi:hypothetical protein
MTKLTNTYKDFYKKYQNARESSKKLGGKILKPDAPSLSIFIYDLTNKFTENSSWNLGTWKPKPQVISWLRGSTKLAE